MLHTFNNSVRMYLISEENLRCKPSRIHILNERLSPLAQQCLQGFLIIEASRSLLWTSDHPDAETSTWQHTTLTRDRRLCPLAGFKPSKWPAADPRLRPRGHWDQLKQKSKLLKYYFCVTKISAHFKYCQSNHCHVSRSNWLWHELRATTESWYKEIDIYVL
jgi:hypothetical protein